METSEAPISKDKKSLSIVDISTRVKLLLKDNLFDDDNGTPISPEERGIQDEIQKGIQTEGNYSSRIGDSLLTDTPYSEYIIISGKDGSPQKLKITQKTEDGKTAYEMYFTGAALEQVLKD